MASAFPAASSVAAAEPLTTWISALRPQVLKTASYSVIHSMAWSMLSRVVSPSPPVFVVADCDEPDVMSDVEALFELLDRPGSRSAMSAIAATVTMKGLYLTSQFRTAPTVGFPVQSPGDGMFLPPLGLFSAYRVRTRAFFVRRLPD